LSIDSDQYGLIEYSKNMAIRERNLLSASRRNTLDFSSISEQLIFGTETYFVLGICGAMVTLKFEQMMMYKMVRFFNFSFKSIF
jgi:hypothetical protein